MSTEHLQGDYILLCADSLRLLLLQTEMTAIAHLQDRAEASRHCLQTAAQLQTAAEDITTTVTPVFVALSEQLRLLPQIPGNRFLLTVWAKAPALRWCWSDVQLLNQVQLPYSPIPQVLRHSGTPVTAIATLANGDNAFVADSESLWRYLLQTQGMNHDKQS